MIISWMCYLCRHLNDNNNGPCHRCGGETKTVKGHEEVIRASDWIKIKEYDALVVQLRKK